MSFTARSGTKTIGPKSLINRPANASDRCEGSNPRLTRNDSSACTYSFGTCFAWGVTSYGLLTTGLLRTRSFCDRTLVCQIVCRANSRDTERLAARGRKVYEEADRRFHHRRFNHQLALLENLRLNIEPARICSREMVPA